jgi:hypothetical protein
MSSHPEKHSDHDDKSALQKTAALEVDADAILTRKIDSHLLPILTLLYLLSFLDRYVELFDLNEWKPC